MADWLSDLPVWWANLITVVLFIAIAVCCFLVPAKAVIADATDRRRWRDLRWWALALITVQLGIYAVFS